MIPDILDGLRVPVMLAAEATLAAAADGHLEVTSCRPADQPAGGTSLTGPLTVIVCDGGAHHYFHFMEAMIWLLAVQRCFLPGTTIGRIVFAWPWDNTRQNRVQAGVLAALLPACPWRTMAVAGRRPSPMS